MATTTFLPVRAAPSGCRQGQGSSRLLKIWIVRAIFVVFAGKQPE
jgi:hypothetical protein